MAWNFEKPRLIASDENSPRIDKRDSDDLVKEAEKSGRLNKIRSKKALIKYKKIHVKKLKNLKELTELPKKGEQIRCITQGSFNAYTFITFIIEKENIEEMYLTTFNISDSVIEAVFSLFETEKINRLNIMLSESIKFRMPKRVEQLKRKYRKFKHTKRMRLKLNWNHSKIILLKTEKNYYVIEGSGNLSGNAQIEQYCIDNNKQIYDFHKSWMDDEFKSYEKREEIWE